MALIVEDGTGKTDANSYSSVATADTYFALRGITAWTCPDTAKEIVRLTLSSGASADGDITITLNGVDFVVAVTAGNANQVCAEIRAATFAGWVTSGVDGYVIFTATVAECRNGVYALDADTTGVVGAFTETQVGSSAVKETALVRGTQAIDGMYNSRWPGYKSSQDQALAWPRLQAWDLDGYPLTRLPIAVVNATLEAALIELVTPGALSPSLDRGGAIIREKVGPIETQYSESASAVTVYNTIRNALASIVRVGGAVVFRRG
jgi:hypothetical protein